MLFRKLMGVPAWAHGAMLIAGVMVFQRVKGKLDALYAASGHPVDYATGQTAFDGTIIKGYYAEMQDLGTLDVYVATQKFDYLFMIALAGFGILLGTFVARFARDRSWGRRLGLSAAVFASLGAVMDALENLVSFVMLSQPQTFSDWLALPYSGFATVKFALITLAMLAVIMALISVVIGRVFNLPKIA